MNGITTTAGIGSRAESAAADYLQQHGLRIIEKNFSCKVGELDLIAQDGQHLVFVEVRYRKTDHYGGALASVDQRKQRKLLNAAQFYLQRRRINAPCRFDIVAITGPLGTDTTRINWVRNAFGTY